MMSPQTMDKLRLWFLGLALVAGVISIAWFQFVELPRRNSKEGLEEHVSRVFELSVQSGQKPQVILEETGNGIWTGVVRYEGGIIYRVSLDAANRNKIEWDRDGRQGEFWVYQTP